MLTVVSVSHTLREGHGPPIARACMSPPCHFPCASAHLATSLVPQPTLPRPLCLVSPLHVSPVCAPGQRHVRAMMVVKPLTPADAVAAAERTWVGWDHSHAVRSPQAHSLLLRPSERLAFPTLCYCVPELRAFEPLS